MGHQVEEAHMLCLSIQISNREENNATEDCIEETSKKEVTNKNPFSID